MRTETLPAAQPPERNLLLDLAGSIARTYGCPQAGRPAAIRSFRLLSRKEAVSAAASAERFRCIAQARRHGAAWLDDNRKYPDARYDDENTEENRE